MRSFLAFLAILAAAVLSASARARAEGRHSWDGWSLAVEVETSSHELLPPSAGIAVEYARQHVALELAGILRRNEPHVALEGIYYPFLWNVARPFAWLGAQYRVHDRGWAATGGIGGCVSIDAFHFGARLGLDLPFHEERWLQPALLLGVFVGWHLF